MGAPHADRDGSEEPARWELEEGDTGAPLLREPLPALDAVATEVRRLQAVESGLPEYLDKLRADREGLEWEAAYWEWGARFGRRKRVWRSGWDHWSLELSVDEYSRRTLVVGPWVIALWGCRCEDCKAEERDLLAIIDDDGEDS